MSYTPTEWKNGDVITAEKLNKLESAVVEASNKEGFELSDRIAKGIDDNGDVVIGAVLEGAVEDVEIPSPYAPGPISVSANCATGEFSHAEGATTKATNYASHAEGLGTLASGMYSHSECSNTIAQGNYSHAEGHNTTASGESSHAEGSDVTASAGDSHAEGDNTTASGSAAHAEGSVTIASGSYSHTEGTHTIANHKSQHVFGEYNIADTSDEMAYNRGNYIEIVGNGTNVNARSNARALDWSGNEWIQGSYSANGSLTLGKGTADEVTITAAQLKQLLAMLS